MKVLVLILALFGVGGVSAVAAPSPTPPAESSQTSASAPAVAVDAFVRPPRMERTVVVAKPAAAPVKAQPKPKPKATPAPVVKKKTTQVSGPAPTGPWAAGQWGRFPASVERSARCIAKHESWNAGLWRAINDAPYTTASGFAQWLDRTWRVQAKRAGVGTQYRRAYLAPPAVQAAVFAYQAQHHGLYPWKGTHCPGT